MGKSIRLVATDIDGTFLRPDRTYDEGRFARILARMEAQGCRFVIASGNQYYQLRRFVEPWAGRVGFVAENGGHVRDGERLVYASSISREAYARVLELCDANPEVSCVVSCLDCAYMERGSVPDFVFDIIGIYYPRLAWADDLRLVDDQILKLALGVPEELTASYVERIRADLGDVLDVTSSGHGAIDLIEPGCHKAAGLARLLERWGIAPEECAAFGDGGNDVELLRYVGHGYAMDNAPDNVKAAADYVCPSNSEDGVLVTLEELFA